MWGWLALSMIKCRTWTTLFWRDVLAGVKRSPTRGMYWVSSITVVPQTQIWRILHQDSFYLCHIQCVYHRDITPTVYNFVNDRNRGKSTQTLIDASKEVCLDVNTEKTKYASLSCHQNAGQNHDINIGNRCSENVAQFRYLGTTITNENLIQEDIKRRLNSGNACYHSVQNLSSCRLLSKK
jgi:hypothetical protein